MMWELNSREVKFIQNEEIFLSFSSYFMCLKDEKFFVLSSLTLKMKQNLLQSFFSHAGRIKDIVTSSFSHKNEIETQEYKEKFLDAAIFFFGVRRAGFSLDENRKEKKSCQRVGVYWKRNNNKNRIKEMSINLLKQRKR